MADYISKHDAYTTLKDLEAAYIYPPVKEAYGTAARRIDQIKPADVQPVKHGKWLDCVYDDMLEYWSATCSCCGNISTDPFCIIGSHKNCEHCGADMRGDTNE